MQTLLILQRLLFDVHLILISIAFESRTKTDVPASHQDAAEHISPRQLRQDRRHSLSYRADLAIPRKMAARPAFRAYVEGIIDAIKRNFKVRFPKL
jgi:hypothetical protein